MNYDGTETLFLFLIYSLYSHFSQVQTPNFVSSYNFCRKSFERKTVHFNISIYQSRLSHELWSIKPAYYLVQYVDLNINLQKDYEVWVNCHNICKYECTLFAKNTLQYFFRRNFSINTCQSLRQNNTLFQYNVVNNIPSKLTNHSTIKLSS